MTEMPYGQCTTRLSAVKIASQDSKDRGQGASHPSISSRSRTSFALPSTSAIAEYYTLTTKYWLLTCATLVARLANAVENVAPAASTEQRQAVAFRTTCGARRKLVLTELATPCRDPWGSSVGLIFSASCALSAYSGGVSCCNHMLSAT